MKRSVLLLIAVLAVAALPAAGASCDSLTRLTIPHVTITAAEAVAAGAFAPPAAGKGGKGKGGANPYADLPAFCRVVAVSRPTSDSEINIEVWLPAGPAWNGKLEANGNGGWNGNIAANTLAEGLRRGYATTMTDTGHQGGSASFALGHPEKVIDFGHRSIHEMAVVAKAAVLAYYESPARHSYFNGCSAGGRQGLKAAQMYPGDFDGIVAGSPGLMWTGRAAQAIWIAQASNAEPGSLIPREKFDVVHQAALAACDDLDGVKDGVMEDPTRCTWDPAKIQCQGADAPNCLTALQVATARKIYSDVTNPRTGKVYFPGHERGSELGWNTMAGPNPFGPGLDLFKYVVFQDENWDYKKLNWDSDMERTLQAGEAMNAMDPNLKPFFDRGGKLIQYHGWNDPQISPRSSTIYFNSVVAANGGVSKVQENYRLFMVPGMAHCGGGEGTSSFDMLTALEDWVEKGQAPARVEGARVANGQTNRTRPLCPYPQVAKYKGSGSIDESANFSCALP
jgi:feruloyl esterase